MGLKRKELHPWGQKRHYGQIGRILQHRLKMQNKKHGTFRKRWCPLVTQLSMVNCMPTIRPVRAHESYDFAIMITSYCEVFRRMKFADCSQHRQSAEINFRPYGIKAGPYIRMQVRFPRGHAYMRPLRFNALCRKKKWFVELPLPGTPINSTVPQQRSRLETLGRPLCRWRQSTCTRLEAGLCDRLIGKWLYMWAELAGSVCARDWLMALRQLLAFQVYYIHHSLILSLMASVQQTARKCTLCHGSWLTIIATYANAKLSGSCWETLFTCRTVSTYIVVAMIRTQGGTRENTDVKSNRQISCCFIGNELRARVLILVKLRKGWNYSFMWILSAYSI